MHLIERETHNFILKFRELIPRRETVLRAPKKLNLMNSHVSVKFMQFFEKKVVHVVIDRYFSLFLTGFENFS